GRPAAFLFSSVPHAARGVARCRRARGRVIEWVPAHVVERPPLGGKVLVVTTSTGPSDAAVRVATLLARPDGGHSDVVITRMPTEPAPDPKALRAVEKLIFRHR